MSGITIKNTDAASDRFPSSDGGQGSTVAPVRASQFHQTWTGGSERIAALRSSSQRKE